MQAGGEIDEVAGGVAKLAPQGQDALGTHGAAVPIELDPGQQTQVAAQAVQRYGLAEVDLDLLLPGVGCNLEDGEVLFGVERGGVGGQGG